MVDTIGLVLIALILALAEIAIASVRLVFWTFRSTEEGSWAFCAAVASVAAYFAYSLWATRNNAAIFFGLIAGMTMTIKLVLFFWLRRRGRRNRNT